MVVSQQVLEAACQRGLAAERLRAREEECHPGLEVACHPAPGEGYQQDQAVAYQLVRAVDCPAVPVGVCLPDRAEDFLLGRAADCLLVLLPITAISLQELSILRSSESVVTRTNTKC